MTSQNWQNVTVDAVNSTLIAYSPPDCVGSGWTINNQTGFLASYRNCTTLGAVGPSANITFTGTAVYYVSPPLQGQSMRFMLDGVLSDDVNLATAGHPINKTVSTRIVWKQTDLNNTQHTLELLPGTNSSTLSVDALMITQLAPNITNTTSPAASPSPTTQSPLAGALTGVSMGYTTYQKVTIAFGSIFGSFSFFVFVFLFIFLSRRRRELDRSAGWAKAQSLEQPFGFDAGPMITLNHIEEPPFSPVDSGTSSRLGEQVMPMQTLPNVPHGSFTTYEYGSRDATEVGTMRGTMTSDAPLSRASSSKVHPQDIPLSTTSASKSHLSSIPPPSGPRRPSFVSRLEPVRRSTTQPPQ
ncbi:hypothetical protein CPB84DRAFT_1845701 [Gymnopilus junonius]|uniref:Transmembrane protein n=1 Tax=Gymnopilus junonius TaxID=109634 RepID=A0A9P5TQ10_GYMJU|nr:hypothetical protein CPB84DRAFT_1845701 [Gymnopilus junonius]